MPAYRFPILLWQHFAQSGGESAYTACLVEDEHDIAAVADTRADAAAQIKELLQWQYKETPSRRKPDFIDPELSWVKVEVRPEYAVEQRVFPSRELVSLRMPCVRGVDSSGLRRCSLPTIGVRFSYDEDDALPALVAQYVQTALKGLTPQQLSRRLPPAAAELDDVVILVPSVVAERELPPDLAALAEVAEPIGARGFRRLLARPWQRDAEVTRLAGVLAKERASVLLRGESGCGKTAILAEAVRNVEREHPQANEKTDEGDEQSPSALVRNRFWLTSAARLIAGMQYLGQWQQRLEQIIQSHGEIGGALCVENLLDLVRTGGIGPNDGLAAFLVPYVQRGELRLIAEATPAELDACRRLLPAMASLFTTVEIPPFTPRQAVDAMDQLAGTLRQNLRVNYERSAIDRIYRLFARFMPYQSFPGRAAAFLHQLFDRAARSKSPIVTASGAVERFVHMTGLPERFLRDEITLRFEDVETELRQSVVGQPRACHTAAGVITTFKAGLNDPNRPLSVLLFCGPTGVGKTELAKAMAQLLFGSGQDKERRLVRLDMSEYSGGGAVERLLGPPDGEPSEFIKRIRQQPFSVVLLDEIEKAAADVFDVLLGVFDEGRLTDRYGRLTTFRSALIVMTSNLGAERMAPFGLSRSAPGGYEDEALSFFRPEFFNRIDAVVTFDPLSADSIRQITIAELTRVAQREGLRERRIELRWTDAAVEALCRVGYDSRYGARPLQRAIETMVVAPLARLLVERQSLTNTVVLIEADDDGRIELR
jgi:ATP-dependent Clp protease ATP-binding subunit ClpC